jgi:hypothetical protein
MIFSLYSAEANFRVARRLDEVAEILEVQEANPYRVQTDRARSRARMYGILLPARGDSSSGGGKPRNAATRAMAVG